MFTDSCPCIHNPGRHKDGRGKRGALPGAAYWLSGLHEAPHAQASVPASGAPESHHPNTEKPIRKPAREAGGGVLMGLQGCVCAIATVKGSSGSEVDTTATHPD